MPSARAACPVRLISCRGAPASVRRFWVSCSTRASSSWRSKCSSVGSVAAIRAIRTPSARLVLSVSSDPSVPDTSASSQLSVNSPATSAAPSTIWLVWCAVAPSIITR